MKIEHGKGLRDLATIEQQRMIPDQVNLVCRHGERRLGSHPKQSGSIQDGPRDNQRRNIEGHLGTGGSIGNMSRNCKMEMGRT